MFDSLGIFDSKGGPNDLHPWNCLPDPNPGQSMFFDAFAAAGYVVVATQSAHEAALLSLQPRIEAVVINGTCRPEDPTLAEKIKFLNPELPVVLICPESQINDHCRLGLTQAPALTGPRPPLLP